MSLKIGIVGLPNVGKSTLFNALLKKQVAEVANYPFCTIEPNVGVIEVPDDRLPILAKIVGRKKIVPAAVEFYDIAGLVKNASKGEGLGNQFLSHIREVAAIIHVVRLFEDQDIVHVDEKHNPNNDIVTIETELILADLQTLEKQKEPNSTVLMIKKQLDRGIPASKIPLSEEEKQGLRPLNLLTIKPVIYLFNLSEAQLRTKNKLPRGKPARYFVPPCESDYTASSPPRRGYSLSWNKTETYINQIIDTTDQKAQWLCLCAKLENEIASLPENEQLDYLKSFQLEETGLSRLIKKAYETLDLISFLTTGQKSSSAQASERPGEVRAWTIKAGTKAQQAAGVIHSDFEKHFIRADVISFTDFVKYDGWATARQLGQVQTVGKEYLIKDGDIVEFKTGV